jgi:hypothetical protein
VSRVPIGRDTGATTGNVAHSARARPGRARIVPRTSHPVFRFFPLLRALLRCFFPGGPSGLPAGVLLSPFFFSLAISDPTPPTRTRYEARGVSCAVEWVRFRPARSVRGWSLVVRAELASMDLFAADEQSPHVLLARLPDDHWSDRRARGDFQLRAADRALPLAVHESHLEPASHWTTDRPSARGLLARKTSAQATVLGCTRRHGQRTRAEAPVSRAGWGPRPQGAFRQAPGPATGQPTSGVRPRVQGREKKAARPKNTDQRVRKQQDPGL